MRGTEQGKREPGPWLQGACGLWLRWGGGQAARDPGGWEALSLLP